MKIAPAPSPSTADDTEQALRTDLAAAFRLAARFGWHESVGNHFSAAVSDDGTRFLMNPKWSHFEKIRASDLQLLDAGDETIMSRPDAPDATAWCLHSTIHRTCPGARVVLHCHPEYATTLATLKDPMLKPIDQNTARFYGRVAVDLAFGGMADEQAEGDRIAAALGTSAVLMMGNHGVTVAAATVAEAFEELYFFERAAKTLLLAYASGQPLNVMSPAVASKTAASWKNYGGMAFAHFDHLKATLDEQDPSFRS